MDDEIREAIAAELTAQNFLLEGLYAMFLAQDDDPVAAGKRVGRESLRQLEDLPAQNEGTLEKGEAWRIRQLALHRLERFWSAVDYRLRQHADRKG